MKKTLIRTLAALMVVISLCTLLASCGGISGTYVAQIGGDTIGSKTTFVFSGKKVSLTQSVSLGTQTSSTIEGTYELIDNPDGTQSITFTFPDDAEDAEDFSGTLAFEKGENYIKIAGLEFKKVEK